MDEKKELTPEEKEKLKKVLKGAAVLACAYFGAKCGAKAALKEIRIDLYANGVNVSKLV